MNANRPYTEHAREFLVDPEAARLAYPRNGRHVAVNSQWMGTMGFYPKALETILTARPRTVDLGAGACRLLIEVLQTSPETRGIGLELSPEACLAAKQSARFAGVDDRLTVVQSPVQAVAADATALQGADVIHAGFVFHELLPAEEETADRILANCREALSRGGIMAVTDAVPDAHNERERRFNAAVGYFHHQCAGLKLLTEQQWVAKLRSAGFSTVTTVELPCPTARLFVAEG
jgi:spermidine synthase